MFLVLFSSLLVLAGRVLAGEEPSLGPAGSDVEGGNYETYLTWTSSANEDLLVPEESADRPIYAQYRQLASSYLEVPGSVAYDGARYASKGRYDASALYASYLTSGPYGNYMANCSNGYGQRAQISQQDIDEAFRYATDKVLYGYDQYEGGAQYYSNSSRSAYSGASVPNPSDGYTMTKEREAFTMEAATEYLMRYKCLNKYSVVSFMPSIRMPQVAGRYTQPSCYQAYGNAEGKQWNCGNSKYRSLNGWCNNPKHPYWGRSHVCHLRLLPADYADGVSAPRRSISGGPLPSPRFVANVLDPDVPNFAYYTHFKMQWGQFVNHDITNTPTSAGPYGQLDCCGPNPHPQCYPIRFNNDPYQYGRTCMNFIRSVPCPLCTLGARQQMNAGTSFMDLSTVYGSNIWDMLRIRAFKDGLMRVAKDTYGEDIAPPGPGYASVCQNQNPSMPCMDAGDHRINQHPGVATMQILALRRHNQHARGLKEVNPHWSDDYVFQEARRLTIAEYQMITMGEYLPLGFGPHLMRYFNLGPLTSGYTQYEPYTDPTTWNDYATASCRFGHSQVRSLFSVLTDGSTFGQYNSSASYWIRDWFGDPSLTYQGYTKGITRGLLLDIGMNNEPFVTNDLRNYLFKGRGSKWGLDLPAINIQRGRDHGIPSYVQYIKFCFNINVNDWRDLEQFIPADQIRRLRSVYEHWNDIDFWVGGVSERHFPDSVMGPTFACVNGIQAYHTKFGDRFYFEHGGQSGSFNPAQLDNIRGTTSLARWVCTTAYLDAVQRFAFFAPSEYNPPVECSTLPEIDYSLWAQSQSYE